MAMSEVDYLNLGGGGDTRTIYVFGYSSSSYIYNIYRNIDNKYVGWSYDAAAGVVYNDEYLSITKGQYHVHTITFKKDGYYMDRQHTTPVKVQAGGSISYNSPSNSMSIIMWFE